MENKQVKSINIEGVAFLAWDIHLMHGTCPLTKMYIPQGRADEFNKNVRREITGNTTQYYQNTTKGFEFTDFEFTILNANFEIKAVLNCKGR